LHYTYVACLCDIIDAKPSSYEEVAKNRVWKDVKGEEYQSIVKNDIWDVVPKMKDKSIISSKWIYKMKHAVDESTKEYKDRFVTRKLYQKEGIDYEETFSPLSLVVVMKWKVHKMDVNTALLNCEMKEEIYLENPQGFEVHYKETRVWILNKSL
jgi:hypothetical protein